MFVDLLKTGLHDMLTDQLGKTDITATYSCNDKINMQFIWNQNWWTKMNNNNNRYTKKKTREQNWQ